jgi:hypothetical protein
MLDEVAPLETCAFEVNNQRGKILCGEKKMANQLLGWLSGGDLRSDGLAAEVAAKVLENPALFDDLVEGLDHPDDVVRGRTADALEKVARLRPEQVNKFTEKFMESAMRDPVPMVRWHLAMVLGDLAIYPENIDQIYLNLVSMLADDSVFVRSWVITSLTIIGRLYPARRERIVRLLAPLAKDKSVAIRTRTRKAMDTLTNETQAMPEGWVKAAHLKHL